MGSKRTVKKKTKKPVVRRRRKRSASKSRLSASTMQIPVEAVFGERSKGRAACLDILCPGRDPSRCPLNQKTVVIGRHSDCEITLPLTNVSREHAEVNYDGEEYVLEDLDSTNGTFVNNVKVSRCVLRDNDLICIGESKILFLRHKGR